MRDEAPPQARTLPSPRVGASDTSYQQVLSIARRLQRLMKVPRGGSAQMEVRLELEDMRVANWEISRQDTSGSRPTAPATAEAEVTFITQALQPFMHALGERTVVLSLEGNHRESDAQARWFVVEARTLEPPAPPREVADFGREYMAMRERILDSRYLELMVADAGYVETGVTELHFPWGVPRLIARDTPLMALTREGRFSHLFNHEEGSRDWVAELLSTGV